MRTLSTDVVILGAGTAGLNARREVEKAGKDWVMVERGPYGTTCARVGCMPSKLLIAAAEAAHGVGEAGRFGIEVDPAGVVVDGQAVMARVRSERDRFVGFVVRSTEALPEARRVEGTARFVGPTTVAVDDHTQIAAGTVVLATGSSPWIPPGLDEVGDRLIVNDDVFEWTDLPASVAVLGTGVIGLELGQALHRLGVRVRLFDVGHGLGGLKDPVVKDRAIRAFSDELSLHLGYQLDEASRTDDGDVRLRWRDEDGTAHDETFTYVLAATGRTPNVRDLGLEHLGVSHDRFGVPAHDPGTLQVGDLPVFLAGDVTHERPLLHEASDEGRIAGANAAGFPRLDVGMRRVPMGIVFSDPQCAFVGERFPDLPEDCTAVGEVSYDDQGRSRVIGKNKGHLRIYADRRTCRMVGAEMVGPHMEHIAHLLGWAIQQGLTPVAALKMPFYHPVIEEGVRTALRDLAKDLRVSGHCAPADHAHGPGQ